MMTSRIPWLFQVLVAVAVILELPPGPHHPGISALAFNGSISIKSAQLNKRPSPPSSSTNSTPSTTPTPRPPVDILSPESSYKQVLKQFPPHSPSVHSNVKSQQEAHQEFVRSPYNDNPETIKALQEKYTSGIMKGLAKFKGNGLKAAAVGAEGDQGGDSKYQELVQTPNFDEEVDPGAAYGPVSPVDHEPSRVEHGRSHEDPDDTPTHQKSEFESKDGAKKEKGFPKWQSPVASGLGVPPKDFSYYDDGKEEHGRPECKCECPAEEQKEESPPSYRRSYLFPAHEDPGPQYALVPKDERRHEEPVYINIPPNEPHPHHGGSLEHHPDRKFSSPAVSCIFQHTDCGFRNDYYEESLFRYGYSHHFKSKIWFVDRYAHKNPQQSAAGGGGAYRKQEYDGWARVMSPQYERSQFGEDGPKHNSQNPYAHSPGCIFIEFVFDSEGSDHLQIQVQEQDSTRTILDYMHDRPDERESLVLRKFVHFDLGPTTQGGNGAVRFFVQFTFRTSIPDSQYGLKVFELAFQKCPPQSSSVHDGGHGHHREGSHLDGGHHGGEEPGLYYTIQVKK